MRPAASRVRRSGFTLIEVLVSLAIFAFAAVVLGAAYLNVLNGYDAVKRRHEHVQDLRSIRALVTGEPDRQKAEAGGDLLLPDNRTARWTATIEPSTVADLFRVALECEVRDPARAQPWTGKESFLLLRPTWSDPAARDRLRQAARERIEKSRESRR